MSKNQFRILVIASFVIAILSGAVEYVWPDPVAEIIYKVIIEQEEEKSELNAVILGVGVASIIGSFVGLLMLKSWGRFMYALVFLLMLPMYLLIGAGVYSGLSQLASDFSMVLSGVLLALVFYSPVANYFENEV